MRRLMTLVMIFVMAQQPVLANDENGSTNIPILSSLGDIIADLGNNIYELIVPPYTPLPKDVHPKEVKCLADNIYFEAKNEPYEGQLAVAQVTLNRVEHPQYPKTVCAVVWQQNKDRRSGRKVAQFSWTLDGRPDVPKSKTAYEQAYAVAEEALLYGAQSAIVGTEALFYHATYVNPRWARQMERITRIGNHIFYQPKS